MEEDPQSQLTTFFTDPLLLSYITEYLSIKDQLVISTLNKKLRFVMETYFTSVLKENKLHLIHSKSSIHQMHFYFDRCLRIFRHQKEEAKDEAKEAWSKQFKKKKEVEQQVKIRDVLKATIEKPFKFTVITYFEVGPIFTACLDNKSKAIVLRTNQLIYLAEHKDKAKYVEQPEVRDLSAKAQKLVLISINGEVVLLETDKLSMQLNVNRQVLPWSSKVPVRAVHGSFTYCLFELQNPHIAKHLLCKHLFQDPVEDSQVPLNEAYSSLVVLNMLNGCLSVVKVPVGKLVSIAVGHRQAYLVSESHQCFVAQFQLLNEVQREITARPFQPLSSKKIVKVASGYNFFFALERNIEHVEEWNNERLSEWLREIGFGAFVKIARAEKITGKMLKTMERKYMENVLGLTKLNMQQKFMLCIEQLIEGRNEYEQLWAWGKNQFGQLGTTNANFIAHPQRVKMDFLADRDRIDSIFCGWHQTFIRTHRGKIYASLRASERKKKKNLEEKQIEDPILSQEQDFRRQAEDNSRFKHKKRKFTEDYKEQNKKMKGHHKKFEQQQHWVEHQGGKAFFVSAFKDYTFIIQCPDQFKFEPVKQKKLRTAKAVMDKILWAGPADKSEFKIGIIDKDMGTIEVSLLQVQTFGYKENSIRYVKRKNIVVWDRQTKLDHF